MANGKAPIFPQIFVWDFFLKEKKMYVCMYGKAS